MKKLIYLLSILTLSIQMVSAQTVKKILLEEFTGAWCGGCPAATDTGEHLLTANPSSMVPVSWHYNDTLQIPEVFDIKGAMNINSYPQGGIDRYKYPGNHNIGFIYVYWRNAYNQRKTDTAIVSVSFADTHFDGTNYTATVNVEFVSAPVAGVPLKMNVYLTEDSIAAMGILEQDNYTDVQNGANPLVNYFHNDVMRKSLGGTWGFASTIPASVSVGTVYSEHISFTIDSNWKKDQINVIAFVAYDGDTALNRKEILNTDQVRLSTFSTLDVHETSGNLEASVYPNPAGIHDMLKIFCTLKQDAKISMEVFNTLGQLISKPYQSFEIAGIHTIQWSASEATTPVTPGVYFIRLTTDKGLSGISRVVFE